VAKLYSVDMSKATNILDTRWNNPTTAPTLEALEDPASAQIRVLPKSLVLDLSSLEAIPEKIEGVAVLDRNTLAVVNDNDFDSEESKYDASSNVFRETILNLAEQLYEAIKTRQTHS